MALFLDAPVEPDALTTFVREVPFPGDLQLLQEFPTLYRPDNTVDFAAIIRTNRTARYRSFDGRIHVSARDVGAEARIRLAPLSSSLNMGEYERLQLEFARAGGTNRRALADSVYNDATNLTREVQARLEQAWGQVLSTGSLAINENGLTSTANFGVPFGHFVGPVVSWTDIVLSTPLTDLIAWNDVYTATNGVGWGTIRTSLRVTRLLQRNAEIIAAVHGAAAGRTRVTRAELNDLLSSEGLGTLAEPYDTLVDVDGVPTPVIPNDIVTFTPTDLSQLGYTAMGVSATALELIDSSVSDMSFENAPGIVGVVEKVGPPYRQFVYVDAVGMPVLANAGMLMIADVVI